MIINVPLNFQEDTRELATDAIYSVLGRIAGNATRMGTPDLRFIDTALSQYHPYYYLANCPINRISLFTRSKERSAWRSRGI